MAEFSKMRNDPRGWITPSGDYLYCSMWNHLDLSKAQLSKDLSRMTKEWEASVREAEQPHLDLIKQGDHPEWHYFECWYDGAKADFRQNFMAQMYREGWVRVGSHGDNGASVEFEGSQEGLEKARKHIDELVEAGREVGRFKDVEMTPREV